VSYPYITSLFSRDEGVTVTSMVPDVVGALVYGVCGVLVLILSHNNSIIRSLARLGVSHA